MRKEQLSIRLTAATVLLLTTLHAHASGQYEVEDADLVDPRSCEFEAWHNNAEDANFFGGTCRGEQPFDVTLEAEMPRFAREAIALEGKYLLRGVRDHGYGLGLFGGAVYDTDTDRVEETYLLVPFTTEPVTDRLALHLNLGGVHVREGSDTELFWGVGTETALFGPVALLAEVFGNEEDDPTVHAGLQAAFFDEQLIVDLSWFEPLESGAENGWAGGIRLGILSF